ncbi:KAP family P-loop NTPase fold protein [Bartonella sp. LJL80]
MLELNWTTAHFEHKMHHSNSSGAFMYYSLPEKEIKLYEVGFETDPDDKDILERAAFGKSLSAFLERVQDPLVVAVDGKWGTGKSYFLKKWVGAHTLENDGQATTVYFDAFAHDYFDDPLADLISTITERLMQIDAVKYKHVIDELNAATRQLAQSTAIGAWAFMSGAASLFTNGASDVTQKGLKKAYEQYQENVEKLWANCFERDLDKHKIIKNFHNTLRKFTEITSPEPTPYEILKAEKSADSDKEPPTYPLIIVIDELDRCRPDYALAILEIIKHFFNVPRVQFVLGVNLESLEHSVKARYGADIDANGYLKRFINLIFELPETIGKSLADKPENSVLLKFFQTKAIEMKIWNIIGEDIQTELQCVSRNKTISLRDAGKILSYTSLVPLTEEKAKNMPVGWKIVIAALVVASIISPETYKKLVTSTIDEKELLNYYGSSPLEITDRIHDEYNTHFNHTVALRIMIWEFIRENGKPNNLLSEELCGRVAQLLNAFGMSRDYKLTLINTNREYLNLINILKKDDSNA